MDDDREAREYWDDRYRDRGIAVPNADDPCARHTLAHFGDLTGRRILDLGCGTGDYSVLFAARGAHVVAVDRSEVAIAALAAACTGDGPGSVEPIAADAFEIDRFGTFDCVFGKFILHHLEPFPEFVERLRAATRPEGLGYFYENNGRSRALLWARAHVVGRFGIPRFGTDEEFPITPDELEVLRQHFDLAIDVAETYLVRLGVQYLLRSRLMGPAERGDALLHRAVPHLRRYSYFQGLALRPLRGG
jgi:2-polyprenyl-3-methyl-5-hydroxy-6-metoxy-1,4-benzoquinol methylase